ncbi:MAG: hypothetical protein K2Q22_14540, partial [Cytophagales bacterium]|nr:hypothetical protein [Cytophagales bacterium]
MNRLKYKVLSIKYKAFQLVGRFSFNFLSRIFLFLVLGSLYLIPTSFTSNNLKIARLKYNGGGDWYAN